jgi:hypothetical protein
MLAPFILIVKSGSRIFSDEPVEKAGPHTISTHLTSYYLLMNKKFNTNFQRIG